MAIIAPLSKYKKSTIRLYIIFCLGLALWCGYDGYFNEKWIKDHTDKEGKPETYLTFNREAPAYLGGGAVLLGAYLFAINRKKIVADNGELIIDGKERIAYDSMEKIDKTNFKSKGYFIITYKNQTGKEISRKISDRMYDNLVEILDEVVAKIS